MMVWCIGDTGQTVGGWERDGRLRKESTLTKDWREAQKKEIASKASGGSKLRARWT